MNISTQTTELYGRERVATQRTPSTTQNKPRTMFRMEVMHTASSRYSVTTRRLDGDRICYRTSVKSDDAIERGVVIELEARNMRRAIQMHGENAIIAARRARSCSEDCSETCDHEIFSEGILEYADK